MANRNQLFRRAFRNLRGQNHTAYVGQQNRLFASLLISAAIAFALLASLILMFASPPQLLALPIPLPIPVPVAVAVPITVAAAVYVDASRSNLDLLRRNRNREKKSCCGSNGECIFVHGEFSLRRIDSIDALASGGISVTAKRKRKKCRVREDPICPSRLRRHPRKRLRLQDRMSPFWLASSGDRIGRLQPAEIDPLHFAREQVEWDGARSDSPGRAIPCRDLTDDPHDEVGPRIDRRQPLLQRRRQLSRQCDCRHGRLGSVAAVVAVSPSAMVTTPPSVMVATATTPVMVVLGQDDRPFSVRGSGRRGDRHGQRRRDERERNDSGGNQSFHEGVLLALRRNRRKPFPPKRMIHSHPP